MVSDSNDSGYAHSSDDQETQHEIQPISDYSYLSGKAWYYFNPSDGLYGPGGPIVWGPCSAELMDAWFKLNMISPDLVVIQGDALMTVGALAIKNGIQDPFQLKAQNNVKNSEPCTVDMSSASPINGESKEMFLKSSSPKEGVFTLKKLVKEIDEIEVETTYKKQAEEAAEKCLKLETELNEAREMITRLEEEKAQLMLALNNPYPLPPMPNFSMDFYALAGYTFDQNQNSGANQNMMKTVNMNEFLIEKKYRLSWKQVEKGLILVKIGEMCYATESNRYVLLSLSAAQTLAFRLTLICQQIVPSVYATPVHFKNSFVDGNFVYTIESCAPVDKPFEYATFAIKREVRMSVKNKPAHMITFPAVGLHKFSFELSSFLMKIGH